MASRAMREGSVGLMIVGGIALFLVLVGWLRNVQLGRSSYQVTVEFIDARGVQVGTSVNYRGVQVGKVRSITPTNRLVDVVIDISRLDVLIPQRTRVEAQSSALLAETTLDLRPMTAAPETGTVAGPLDEDCNDDLILCDGSRLAGSNVADLTDLIRSMNELAAILNNPQLLSTLETTAGNAVTATQGITELTDRLSGLSESVQGEVGNLSTTLQTANRAANSADLAASSVDATARQLGGVAVQAGDLATRTGDLVTQGSRLIEQNRDALNIALVNVGEAGRSIQGSLSSLQPLINDLSSRQDLVENLAQLTANTRVMTANLRNASTALNDPQNILRLQQTLDAARVTFQNAQKLTSDLDEVTGDPQFRLNLRRLINGLSSLVSSTQQLEQQVAVAQALNTSTSPQQVQQLALLNTEVNLASLGLMRDLAELNQSIALQEATSDVPSSSERKPLIHQGVGQGVGRQKQKSSVANPATGSGAEAAAGREAAREFAEPRQHWVVPKEGEN